MRIGYTVYDEREKKNNYQVLLSPDGLVFVEDGMGNWFESTTQDRYTIKEVRSCE